MSHEPRAERTLVSLAQSPRRMPADWTPPGPAWATSFPDQKTPVVMGYFGTQLEAGDLAPHAHRMGEFFEGPTLPPTSSPPASSIGADAAISFRWRTGPIPRVMNEVSVLPGAGQLFEHINCHPETGLLPYFPATEC